MFHMCQAVQSAFVAGAVTLLYWATPTVAAVHVGQAAGFSQQCPAGDEIGFFQTHVDAHKLSHANTSGALGVLAHPTPSTISELRDALVELNNSNINQEFPGFGGMVGQMVEETLCKKAADLAKPAITKCETTLARVTHHVDQLLTGTLEAGQSLAESSGNSSKKDLAARLKKFENYSNRVLGLGVQQWHLMYDMLNPLAALATQALEDAGMHSLAQNLRLDRVNETLTDVLHIYQAAHNSVHDIGNKSVIEVGITLRRLNETMTTGLSGVDAFAQALNTSFAELTEGLGTGLMSLLPKSCNSIWKQPLASAGLTLTNITLKVQDSVHRLASDLLQAGKQLGIQPVSTTKPASKSGGPRLLMSRAITLSVIVVVAAIAGFSA